MTFDAWLPTYLEFRNACAGLLGTDVPQERGQLQLESSKLEPMLWRSQQFRASAIGHYYRAKLANWENGRAEGHAVSALDGYAKAKANRELWALEDAEGLAKAVESRSIKVAQALKLQA